MKEFEVVIKAAEEAMKKLGEFLSAYQDESEETELLSELKPGEVIKSGYEDIPNFIVLEQFGEETIVAAKDLFGESVPFDSESTDYNCSSLKKRFDGEIYEAFAKVFGAENIVEHEVDLTTVDGQQLYKNPICKVRPLTFDEARKYTHLLENKELEDIYWTCTSWSSKERGWKYSVAVVAPSGGIGNCNCGIDFGVRPVCILKSNIFVSKED